MAPRTRYVSIAWLRSQGACPRQVRLAKRAFGDPIPVTPATLGAANAGGLNLWWLFSKVATRAARVEYTRRQNWAEGYDSRHMVRLLADPNNWHDIEQL